MTPLLAGVVYGRIGQVNGGLEAKLIFPGNRPVFLSLRGHEEIEACARGLEGFAASLRKMSLTHEVLARVVAGDKVLASAAYEVATAREEYTQTIREIDAEGLHYVGEAERQRTKKEQP